MAETRHALNVLVLPAIGRPRVATIDPAATLDGVRGLIDCRLIDSASVPGHQDIVVYVDDEGLISGPVIFLNPWTDRLGITQQLAGTAVVVGTLGPQGERDGEDYDVPGWALERYGL